MIDLYKNIKQLRETQGMSQDDLAKLTGYTNRSSIAKIEKGEVDLPRSKIIAFAKALKTSPMALMGWEKESSNVEPIHVGKTIRIPVYGRIPAGVPLEAVEEIEDYIDVDVETADGKELLALKVVGDSMYPKYLDGDYVLIQRQPDCESGQDCAVRVNGCDVTLKRVIKQTDGIMLQPINPEYEPKKYDYTDEFNPVYIIGVVIELRRKI